MCQYSNLLSLSILGFIAQETLTFPMAKSPLSNKKRMPKNMRASPMPARPRPICVLVLISSMLICFLCLVYYQSRRVSD